jgi:hypothetical protein
MQCHASSAACTNRELTLLLLWMHTTAVVMLDVQHNCCATHRVEHRPYMAAPPPSSSATPRRVVKACKKAHKQATHLEALVETSQTAFVAD